MQGKDGDRMNKAFEKILERLRGLAENYGRLQLGFSDSVEIIVGKEQAIDLAIEIVQEVAEEYKDGWIPCSERLPYEGQDVLVWFEYFRYGNYNRLFQTMGISYVYNGKWSGFVNGSSGWSQLRIMAWQPLPEPYKESD